MYKQLNHGGFSQGNVGILSINNYAQVLNFASEVKSLNEIPTVQLRHCIVTMRYIVFS